ncbi:MAG TPA: pitrilysin family protein [Alphaproteobacteria bacterium]|nr:pitrilysin family protein [Alphaproteobacteria bacterium]
MSLHANAISMSEIPMKGIQIIRAFALAGALVLVAVASIPASAAVTVEEVKSKSGLTAWLVRDRLNPIISMRVLMRNGGAVLDPNGKEGLARFTASLLDEGAGELDSQAFQRRLEDLSISLEFNAGADHLSISLRTLRRNRAEAFRLLRLALTKPRFDGEPVERIRAQMLTSLARRSVRPGYIAGRTFWRAAFPKHPYGRPTRGTPATIKAIGKADLQAYVKSRFARGALVIGVTGDITPDELKAILDTTFASLPRRATPVAVTRVAPATRGKLTVIRRPFPQSVVIFGQPGPGRKDKDFYAAFVMNHILGGGSFSSRLYQEIREKRGLAYSVSSNLSPMRHSAMITGSVATQNARVRETIDQIRLQWKRMADQGATAQELKDAKLYLTGSYPLRFVNTARIAGSLAWLQMLGLGRDYFERRNAIIEAITVADVRRAAKRFLDTDKLYFVVVGQPKGLDEKG